MIKHITIVAGARPNFMKIAPIIHASNRTNLKVEIVHTGQHYDKKMSQDFFEQLDIPQPTINLQAGSGTQSEQTGAIMVGFEKFLLDNPTDLVIVVGDVTSTMACAIVAKKLNTPVAHVEAGIRSYDQTMPEEINRIVTDSISDYFFTTSEVATANLISRGVDPTRVFFVGNTMIDTLLRHQDSFKKPQIWNQLGLVQNNFIVLTLHRPANVDDIKNLQLTLSEIARNSKGIPVVFPAHPRTVKALQSSNLVYNNIHIVEPMSYLEFNYLVKYSKAVITDSGGITEETTVMNVPCMTLRDNTERPETVIHGTNELVGTDPNNIKPYLDTLFLGKWKQGTIPDKWDGISAERIVNIITTL